MPSFIKSFGKGVAAFALIESDELRFPVDNLEIDIGELVSGGLEVVPEIGALSVVVRGGLCFVLVGEVGRLRKSWA